jgi:hypothetical protein
MTAQAAIHLALFKSAIPWKEKKGPPRAAAQGRWLRGAVNAPWDGASGIMRSPAGDPADCARRWDGDHCWRTCCRNWASSAGVSRRPAPAPRTSPPLAPPTASKPGGPAQAGKPEAATINDNMTSLDFMAANCDNKVTVPSPCKA